MKGKKNLKKICYDKLLLKIIHLFLFSTLISFLLFNRKFFKKKKIGVIGLQHSQNIGNNLLKYAIFVTLSNLGYDPYIVGMRYYNHNITFIQTVTKLVLINTSYSEIKNNNFDILMVNSDQTWRKSNIYNYKYFYDIAFLKFAEKWNIPKFVYGASMGINVWHYNNKDKKIAKSLIKNFTGISVREKGTIKLIEKHLGIKPEFVLDPTLLIDKKYYLNLIRNYSTNIFPNDDYIFVYTVRKMKKVISFINKIKERKYEIFWVKDSIKDFLYGIYYCKAVVTDSFHGTVFSIIFNKPFITLINEKSGEERFNSLKEIFSIENRIYDINLEPDITLLQKPLYLNMKIYNSLKKKSIQFLIKNLKAHKQ